MIVKDEEKTLAAGIESLMPYVHEFVIGVDDSSTDRTAEIAQFYAHQYFEFTWDDDFSRVRNLGIDKATGDYILSSMATKSFRMSRTLYCHSLPRCVTRTMWLLHSLCLSTLRKMDLTRV